MWVLYKVWALYKIILCDRVKSLKRGSESHRIRSGPQPHWSKLRRVCNVMLWWSIGHKSSIRTTCILRLWVAKHLNKTGWLLYKVRAPSKTISLMGFKYKNCYRPWARELQKDGPGRIWTRDYLLPRLLQNDPGLRAEEEWLEWKIIVLDSGLSPCWSKSNSS
jgi:hypothetical protein